MAEFFSQHVSVCARVCVSHPKISFFMSFRKNPTLENCLECLLSTDVKDLLRAVAMQ